MNNRSVALKTWRVMLCVVAVLLAVMPSCRQGKPSVSPHDERYAQLDSTIALIRDVDSLGVLARQSHEQNDLMGEMLALRHLGFLLHDQALYNKSIDSHNAALAIATNVADTIEMVAALNGLGSSYRRISDLTTANGHYIKALKLVDAYSGRDLDEVMQLRASTLNGIGNVEMEFCNFRAADSVLRVALKTELDLNDTHGAALNYGHLGNVKRMIGQIDSAWMYYRKSLELNQKANISRGVAMCHQHFGELEEDSRHFSRALEEYKLAYDALKEKSAVWYWLKSCLALVRVNILLGEEKLAHDYLVEAETEALRIGSKEYQAEVQMLHYELCLLAGNSQEALNHYIMGTSLQDSIHGLMKGDEMHSQHIDYELSVRSDEVDVLNRDITNLKRTRKMQIWSQILLLLMAAAVIGTLWYANRMRGRTQRLMRQVEETRSLFFTNVVHQLRSPLSAIMGAIDGIVDIVKDGKATRSGAEMTTLHENADVIERQGNNLLMLVDRILEVGSVRSAIKEPDWRHGDAVTFVKMVLESYRDQCQERNIELVYAPRESSTDIDLVPAYLNTIMGNLIENAINYCRDYGKIIVTTRVSGGKFIIRVADDGMGIGKEDLSHVFEPFYRSAASEQLVDGIGIGLTVVRDMTMALGGTVAVDSMKERGAVFTVTLPCKHGNEVKQRLDLTMEPLRSVAHRVLRHQQLETLDSGLRDSQATGRPVVLVVEDHIDVARVVGRTLEQDYEVHYAGDGEQGLAKAGELRPDLIITDVKMPQMNGIDFCSQLRQAAWSCNIPVIMLSARIGEKDRIRGIKAGADAYLVKPFVREELRAWVSRLIESRRVMREAFADGQPAESPRVTSAENRDAADAHFLAEFARQVEKQTSSGSKLDFDRIALSFKMGETQLRRKIQTLTGKNVPAYVTQLRMEKAMRLLRDNPDSLIGDIAEQCGFQDVAYFSRVFRQHYGMAPSQVRDAGK